MTGPKLLPLVDITGGAGDWQDRALCAEVDPELWFPEKGQSTSDAKRLCVLCEVRAECLEYALATVQRFGVWGGLSERERRRLLKDRGVDVDVAA